MFLRRRRSASRRHCRTDVVRGLAGVIGASSIMTNLLYEIKAVDAKTYAVRAVTLIGAAFLAAAVPTLRATRVNPARTIRAESQTVERWNGGTLERWNGGT